VGKCRKMSTLWCRLARTRSKVIASGPDIVAGNFCNDGNRFCNCLCLILSVQELTSLATRKLHDLEEKVNQTVCRDCGSRISITATRCPRCNADEPTNHDYFDQLEKREVERFERQEHGFRVSLVLAVLVISWLFWIVL